MNPVKAQVPLIVKSVAGWQLGKGAILFQFYYPDRSLKPR